MRISFHVDIARAPKVIVQYRRIPHTKGTVWDVTPPSNEAIAKVRRHLAAVRAARTRKENLAKSKHIKVK